MARQIDMSLPLSQEARDYMIRRGQEYKIADLDARAKNMGLMDQQQKPQETEVAVETVEEEAPPYDQWNKEELKDEARERGLEDSGTKAELVQRLESDDSEA